MKVFLDKLIAQERLSEEEAYEATLQLADEGVNPIQKGAFLTTISALQVTSDELLGFRKAMLSKALKVDLKYPDLVDIVGTGGDNKNTFNISTTTAFVLAGAGYKVAKHGNYGVSSLCGSAQVMEQLGYTFTNDEETLLRQIEKSGICFLFAPLFHPAMKVIAPIRQQLQVKTPFNILGPLLNPASPKYQLSGVYDEAILPLYKNLMTDAQQVFTVLYDRGGYDEISLTDDVHILTNSEDKVVSPLEMGFQRQGADVLAGGDTVLESADQLKAILSDIGPIEQKNVVVANAAMAICTINPDMSWEECVHEARESIASGRAYSSLQSLVSS